MLGLDDVVTHARKLAPDKTGRGKPTLEFSLPSGEYLCPVTVTHLRQKSLVQMTPSKGLRLDKLTAALTAGRQSSSRHSFVFSSHPATVREAAAHYADESRLPPQITFGVLNEELDPIKVGYMSCRRHPCHLSVFQRTRLPSSVVPLVCCFPC